MEAEVTMKLLLLSDDASWFGDGCPSCQPYEDEEAFDEAIEFDSDAALPDEDKFSDDATAQTVLSRLNNIGANTRHGTHGVGRIIDSRGTDISNLVWSWPEVTDIYYITRHFICAIFTSDGIYCVVSDPRTQNGTWHIEEALKLQT